MNPHTPSIGLVDRIKAYGAPRPLCFDSGESPELINYLDLVEKRENNPLPDAVVEFQSRPLLYIVEGDHLSSAPQKGKSELRAIKRTLANRGDISYVGVLKPGQLEVYPVDLNKSLSGKISIFEKDNSSRIFFQSLAQGRFQGKGRGAPDYIHDRIFRLIDSSSKHLLSSSCGLSPGEVLSLIGRALFFRFLKDRRIILDEDLKDICSEAERFEDCFADSSKAALTSTWLDNTFNGDLLPLPDKGGRTYFMRVGKKTDGDLFKHLSAIIFGDKPSGKGYQLHLWRDLDFSHIPVGLLSQVYESFSKKWDPHSKETSIYYTPRGIAGYIVDEAFHSLERPEKAKALDPAAGAGIFLVLAFKRLAAETWKADGVRPDSAKIHNILYNQLVGFDINESALKLAALSLYLTAIELDPDPRPLHTLRFPKPLENSVLFCHRKNSDSKEGPVIGSLGEHVSPVHRGKYDVVIGNPPWTRLGAKYSELINDYTRIVREIAEKRGMADIAGTYRNPDRNPDLPFVWKAMEWARPNGVIALTLPARILFKQSVAGRKAREALFRAVKVNGILNCSNLSDTNAWPKMNQPFCFFFARNSIPDENSCFNFISPYIENNLNSNGRIRIDFSAAEPVQTKMLVKEPWLLKALAVGTPLDIAVIRKIHKKATIPVKEYWRQKKLFSSRGYEICGTQDQFDASQMVGYPDLNDKTTRLFFIDPKNLPLFNRNTLHRPRDIQCYNGPLVLIHKSPGEDFNSGKTILCLEKVAYYELFYGYSGNGHPYGEELIRYLYLIVYSGLFKFYVLATSPEFSIERRVFQKREFDGFPFIPLEKLKDNDREKIRSLSEKLAHDKRKPFRDIDKWVCGIYGLDDVDREVVNDTLEVGLPFHGSRISAEAPPTGSQISTFIGYLKKQLTPFFKTVHQAISINTLKLNSSNYPRPWQFLHISIEKGNGVFDRDSFEKLMDIANEKGASRIFVESPGGLTMGLLNQYRYWTKSRARLCGLEILRNLQSMKGPGHISNPAGKREILK